MPASDSAMAAARPAERIDQHAPRPARRQPYASVAALHSINRSAPGPAVIGDDCGSDRDDDGDEDDERARARILPVTIVRSGTACVSIMRSVPVTRSAGGQVGAGSENQQRIQVDEQERDVEISGEEHQAGSRAPRRRSAIRAAAR